MGVGKQTQNANRAFDSTGPENIKVRGHAQHVYEKYQSLARDAASAGDRVLAENYLQHAEHYFRTIRALQPSKPVTEIVGRETFASGFDIDFEDESVEAAIEATDAAALEREANPQTGGENAEGGEGGGQGGAPNTVAQNQSGQNQGSQGPGGQNQGQGQNRDRWENRPSRDRNDRWENRPPREDRYRDDRPRDDKPREDVRPPREDRPREDRPREERVAREDRTREDRPREDRGDRPRYENRDRPYRERNERSDAEVSAPTVAPSLEGQPEKPARMLRSEDGGESHAPAFLQAAAPPAPGPASEDGGAPSSAPSPSRRRRRRGWRRALRGLGLRKVRPAGASRRGASAPGRDRRRPAPRPPH